LGWRMVDIQAKLTTELDLGEMKPSAFSMLVTNARRRAVAQAAAPAPTAQAAPAVQAVPAPVAPAAPAAPAPARSVDEEMALLRADHARRAPVAVPAPAAVVAAPVAPVVRAAPAPAPAQKPAAAAGTLTRSEKLVQMRALQLAAPEPTDPALIAALRVRKGWLRPDSSIVDKAAVEGLKKLGVLLCPPPDPEGKSIPAKLFNEIAAEYLKTVPQTRLLIEESAVEQQAFWDPDKVYVERTDADIHGNLVTAIKMANGDRLRAARAKASAGS